MKLEKEFKLPEKWCIKIKEEYKEDLNKYLHSNSDKYPGYKEHWNLNTATEKYFFYSEATPETGAHSSDEYYPEFTEITFEQFKQYVLKENIIEKWSKGTYVVFLKDNIQYNKYKKGEIQKIKRKYILSNKESIDFVNGCGNNTTIKGLKWFATLKEAEEFSKSLTKKEVRFEEGKWYKYNFPNDQYYLRCSKTCKENRIYYSEYISTLYNRHSYISKSFDNKYVTDEEVPLEEIQQYLPNNHPDKIKGMKKNYVYVKNQEEWDFVSKKLKYNWQFPIKDFINNKPCISLHSNSWSSYDAYNNNNYYTFEKWLDMNNYTEEYNSQNKWYKDLKDEDYIVFNSEKYADGSFKLNHIFKVKGLYEDTGYENIFSSLGVNIYKDCSGNPNGWAANLFRLATSEEIEMYKDNDGPCDVTTYKMKKEKIPEYIETIKAGLNNTDHKDCKKTLNINESNGKILKVIRRDLPGENSNYDCYVCEDGYIIYVEYCIPSTKKAYEKQENIVGAQESVVSEDEIIINNEKELPLKTPKKNNKKIDIYVENIPKISNNKNEILLTIKKRKKL